MTTLLEKEYQGEFQQLVKNLEKVPFMAFTADGWESTNNNNSFIRLVLSSNFK